MNIDKAIRKQQKSYKRFMLSMCFIFFVLPIALFFSKKMDTFYICYLIFMELLIFLAVIIRIDSERLKFDCDGSRIKLMLGIAGKVINISCEKISLIHVEVNKDTEDIGDFKIIMLASSKFRSDRMLSINLNFLKNHPYVAYHYNRLKILHPEEEYFFTVIKKGKLSKFALLDVIYKNCVYSTFTEDCVEKIKFYRENSQFYKKK